MKQENKFKEHIFVFGSNIAGRHGRGAALYAKQNYGAVYGVGIGRTEAPKQVNSSLNNPKP